MPQLFEDNAATTLSAGINSSVTSVAVTDGSVFPSPTNGDYFMLTLSNTAETAWERVRVTARSTNTLTVVRGQEGSNPAAWSSGDRAELRLTAAGIKEASVDSAALSAVQPFMNKVARGLEDLVILVLGDSTGNDTNEWPYLLCGRLATIFPTHTIKYSLWDGSAWPAPSTLSTGTGSKIITMYNGSVAGALHQYALAGRWAVMVAAITPDLMMINYGHNEGSDAVSYMWAGDFLSLTESLTEQHPGAGLIHMLQNPGTANNYSGLRHSVYESLARSRGYGLVNVHQVFTDYGAAWTTDLMADAVHPSSAGQLLWAGEVANVFCCPGRRFTRSAMPPSLFTLKGGCQLLKNGDFSAFSAALPDNWTQLSGAPTASKDNTNYESANGYSVIMQAAGGVGCALGQDLPLKQCLGKWITALVRIRIESGATSNTGVVALYNNVDGSLKDNDISRNFVGGAFRWQVMRMFVPTSATTVRLYIWPDVGTTNAACRVDFASVVVGGFPMR